MISAELKPKLIKKPKPSGRSVGAFCAGRVLVNTIERVRGCCGSGNSKLASSSAAGGAPVNILTLPSAQAPADHPKLSAVATSRALKIFFESRLACMVIRISPVVGKLC